MLSNWFLSGLLCLAVAGCAGVPDGSAVGDGGVVEQRAGLARVSFQQGRRDPALEVGPAMSVVQAAQAEIGVREVGENRGQRVDEYNRYTGVKDAPWCASFVSFCFYKAGFMQPRTAWSPALFPAARQLKGQIKYTPSSLGNSGFAETALGLSGGTEFVASRVRKEGLSGGAEFVASRFRKGGLSGGTEFVASSQMGAGLVLGIYYPSKKRIAHCGIVTRVDGDWVYSVEGNTNGSGGREGDGVYAKKRHRRTIAKYADWLRKEGV